MKTKFARASQALKRAWLMFKIRSLETTLDGQNRALRMVSCHTTRWKIEAARIETKRGLATLRAAYSRTLPPGQMALWRLA